MEDEHIYEVHIFTGNVRNGGTDANVSLVIAGTESDTGVRLLVDGERKVIRGSNPILMDV